MDEAKASTAFISSQAPKVVLITGLVFFFRTHFPTSAKFPSTVLETTVRRRFKKDSSPFPAFFFFNQTSKKVILR